MICSNTLLELSGLAASELDEAVVSLELDCVPFASLLSGASMQWFESQGGAPYMGASLGELSQLAQKKAVNVSAIFFQCL